MMEAHPGEAVLNNVIGTHRLCQVSAQNKVEKFKGCQSDDHHGCNEASL
jgi:FlaA1/EpsC-like NDP-sugar epimerase